MVLEREFSVTTVNCKTFASAVAQVFGHPDEMTAQVFPKLTLVTVNSLPFMVVLKQHSNF